MRARSRSSISAMTCLPERLMRAQLVELRVDAVAREAAVARERRRLVDERRLDRDRGRRAGRRARRRASARAAPAARRARVRTRGIDGERLLEADQIARTGRAERRARDQPLEILDRLDRVAELAAVGRAERQLLDGVEAIADRLERDERAQQPRAQQPAAHRRDGAIELVEQRSVAAALRSLDDLEMLERRRIDEQRVGALAVARSRGRARGRPSASSRR